MDTDECRHSRQVSLIRQSTDPEVNFKPISTLDHPAYRHISKTHLNVYLILLRDSTETFYQASSLNNGFVVLGRPMHLPPLLSLDVYLLVQAMNSPFVLCELLDSASHSLLGLGSCGNVLRHPRHGYEEARPCQGEVKFSFKIRSVQTRIPKLAKAV